MKFKILCLVLLLVGQLTYAQMTPLMGHSLRFARSAHGVVEKADTTPWPLDNAGNVLSADKLKALEGLFGESPAAMAWLYWANDALVYERYAAPELRTSLMTTFSVSKTLTSLMIGQALCEGKISTLDDLASRYEPRLIGTAYEKNTIRSLLTMTTGVEHTSTQGANDLRQLSAGQKTVLETVQDKRKLPFQESHFGKRFNYDNTATNVLGMVIKAVAQDHLSSYFSKSIYQAARPIANGRWLRDKNGDEYAMGSFLAIPRDHLRLGIYTLSLIKGTAGEACLQGYAKEMVKKSVSTSSKPAVYGTDTGYGFQIWTDLLDLPKDSVEMRGYGGQGIFLIPESSGVFVVLTAADAQPDERSILNAKKALKLLISP